MSLSASISNALSGMSTSQKALEIVSRNVSNSGTPGYHKQSLSVVDTVGGNSTFARSGQVTRAFSQSLQAYYTNTTSQGGYSSTMTDMLGRLQTFFGKPGDDGSLDTMFGNFQNALQSLGTSPDDAATRANVVSQAQQMVSTLNQLSQNVQSLRQEAESQMQNSVNTLNDAIGSLQKVNTQLSNQNADPASRAALMDQRDRLVGSIAEQIDVNVDYRSDGSAALMTKTGVGILDVKPSTFVFQPAGPITAQKQFDTDPSKSGVGSLKIITAAGTTLDLVQQNVLSSGNLKALIELRDTTLANAQNQLDSVAAGLAQAASTVSTDGTAATGGGGASGYSLDLSSIKDGNDFTLSYSKAGVQKSIRVLRVDDTSKLPLDYTDANGVRVVGMDFAGGATAVAAALAGKLGSGFAVSGAGNTLTVLDDGTGNTTDVGALTSHATVTGTQSGNPALSLFVDSNNADFTDSLSGRPQKLGFAARIAVNSAVLTDNKLLVQQTPGASLGDPARPNGLLTQLQSMRFASSQTSLTDPNSYRLGGTVSDLIGQSMDYAGSVAASAKSDDDTQQQTMDALTTRMDAEYGVNVDEEMARLIELQNAYAANSRIISTVQDLMNRLLEL